MNKILRLALPAAFLGALSLSSCSWEQEDLFELSASQRLEKAITDVRDILTSAPDGWIMDYYYGGMDLVYGGTPVAMSFTEEGVVTVRTLNAIDSPASSLYSIKTDDNLSLDFNTFNENFHYFSDSDSGDGGGQGTGFEGDYEFIIESYSADEIVLTGKKHYGTIKMHPLQGSAAEYLKKAAAQATKYLDIPAVYGLKGTINGIEASASFQSQQYISLTVGEETQGVPFMFTDSGISIYRPVTFGDYTLTDLAFDAETETFSSSDGKTSLIIERNPLGLKKSDYKGRYIFSYKTSNTGAEKTREVELIDGGGSSYLLRGLLPDKDLIMMYDSSQGVLMLLGQNLGGTIEWASWYTVSGALDWRRDLGMKTEWNGDMENFVLTFTHNGAEWIRDGQPVPVMAFIVWNSDGSGEYKGFGDSRFTNIKMTKVTE